MSSRFEKPVRFIAEEVDVHFDRPPVRQKLPPCPDGFTWQGQEYRVTEKLLEWVDFSRRGRSARNTSVEHAAGAAGRGSLGVGRFYFRVRTGSGRIFDLYYDRQINTASDRLGHWYLFRELAPDASEAPPPV
jgi:hypothetical protein